MLLWRATLAEALRHGQLTPGSSGAARSACSSPARTRPVVAREDSERLARGALLGHLSGPGAGRPESLRPARRVRKRSAATSRDKACCRKIDGYSPKSAFLDQLTLEAPPATRECASTKPLGRIEVRRASWLDSLHSA